MSPSMTAELNPVNTPRRRARSVHLVRLVLLAVLLLAAVLAAGCGGGKKDKQDVLLATVGSKEIMGSYYENRLLMLKEDELPRDDKGAPLDMATRAGKEKFLETLINKETMAQTAAALGYASDPQIAGARQSILAYHAGEEMWATEILEPNNTITNEQLDAFYAKLGSSRQCRYVITNFIDQAKEARAMALTGADWQEVVDKYHDGEVDPAGKYEISVPFGRYTTAFEQGVFNTPIGEITEPISTIYGFWVLKVDGEKPGKKPPLEEAKAQILDVTRSRAVGALRDEFKAKVREKYKVFLREDALWKCYLGMPATEELFYPGTQDAVKKEDLKPLDIAPADLDMVFYGYIDSEGKEYEFTLGDYKVLFDQMSVFQRPKRAQMLGGLRSKLTDELEKVVINYAHKDMGYYENENVLLKVNTKIEELLVNKLFTDMVTFDERITPEQLDAFWAEHKHEYFMPWTRSGRLVICANETAANEAAAAAAQGVAWRDILVKYGTDKDNKARSGKLDLVREDSQGPVRDAIFALEVGQVSPAFALGNGTFGVVMLEGVKEPYQIELAGITEDVGRRMKAIRQEESFQQMLAKWKQDLKIVTYPENLDGLKSWRELTAVPVPENLVPRN